MEVISARGLGKSHGRIRACENVTFDLHESEIMGIVGESGSGKTTLLKLLAGMTTPDAGEVIYGGKDGEKLSMFDIPQSARRKLLRTELGFVFQNPEEGLRMKISAGGNIAERLLEGGERSYRAVRENAEKWLEKVELPLDRLDSKPEEYSGGMKARLQIAKNLATEPRVVFLDEPTAGLDVSVQAKILDLLRVLSSEFGLSVLLVTHDLMVAKLLSHRIMVMKDGRVIESGLTDRVLDDPGEPYTQLLVSSILGDA
ncbi:MAG: ATP-binding cassette domain-containing protein [Deltaproteobacteria bacterium]|jgi:putative phosphonate transport system ATP-binding protein|nr:ATP-binding cassette domain-containing protein [Deltaproteobacteria bacterium]